MIKTKIFTLLVKEKSNYIQSISEIKNKLEKFLL